MDKQQSTFPIAREIATRARSMDFYGLSMALPNPDPVLKKIGKDESVYRGLLADAWVSGCLLSRTAGVRPRPWEIDRGRTKTYRTREIELMLRDLDIRRITSNILKAIPFGYQPLEILWHNTGTMMVPRDVVAKPRPWFVFDANNQLRFRSKSNNLIGEALPERKFLIAQHEPTPDNPYGDPVLSSCFWPATFKKAGFKFLMTLAEKYGMPWLIGKVPRGSTQEDIDAMAENLEAMVQDAIIVISDDTSIEILAVQVEEYGDLYLKLIEACRSDIEVAILGHNFTAGRAIHKPVRKDIVGSDARLIEELMNQLIRWICELNWAERSADTPLFSIYKKTDIRLPQAEVDLMRTKMGVQFTKIFHENLRV